MKKTLIFFAAAFMLLSMGYAEQTLSVNLEENPPCIIQFGPSAAQQLGGSVFPTDDPGAEYFISVPWGTVACPFSIVPAEGYEIDKVYVDDVINPTAAFTGNYIFTNVNADHVIFATFKPIMFTITATAGPNGVINPNGTHQVAYGANQDFQAIPNGGCYISRVVIDGVSENIGTGIYSFNHVTANHTISVLFEKNKYPITTTSYGPGYITPENPTVEHGANQTLTFVPNTGYKVSQVKIDGMNTPSAVEDGYYTFQNVTEPHTIEVTFTIMSLTITVTHTAGGEVVPSGVAYVEYGAHSEIYVYNPWDGYHVQAAIVDGVNDEQSIIDGLYRFLNVTTNHTLHLTFAPNDFTIVATASEGGTITPSGIIPIQKGANRFFYFAPQAGYDLVHVFIDGIDDPAAITAGKYEFSDVIGNHTIAAHFEKQMYDVIYQPIPGALITPVNGFTSPVVYGGNYKFTVDLEEGYTQSNVTVSVNDLVLNPANDVYTINNIYKDQIIDIKGVDLNKYQVVAQAYNGGTISPAGVFTVTHGDNKSFEIIPNAGFKVSDIVVNGESEGTAENYTLYDIRGNGIIRAYFAVPQGIEDIEATVKIFSHSNVVTIENDQLISIKQVEIVDMYGRMIWTGQTLTEKTDITLDVATGIYGVRIITESNITTTKVSITK